MRFVVIVACLVALSAAQRGKGGLGRRVLKQYKCDDGSRPDCKCENKPCNLDNPPTCTCEDGSEPAIPPPCDDGTFPECPGACKDGTDAILTSDVIANPPCADGSKPRLRKCACADGTELKPKKD